MAKWIVERWDNNPKNVTYKSWVHISSFTTEREAKALVERMQSPKQLMSYRREE